MKYTNLVEEHIKYDSSPLGDATNRIIRRKAIRKRKRKSLTQLDIFSKEFEQYPQWDKQNITRIMKHTGLTEAQIYKWGWDQKKKLNHQEKTKKLSKNNLNDIFSILPDVQYYPEGKNDQEWCFLSCEEVFLPQGIENHFYQLQKLYKNRNDELKQENLYKKNLNSIFDSFIKND